jgi:protein-S-isoprenylcysteine O-methyltransferase Ste14
VGDDQVFRLILLVGFVIIVPFGIWHRIKSHTGERLDRRQEGLFILVAIRLLGLAGIGAIIIYFINPGRMNWAAMPLPLFVRWIGTCLGPVAGLLIIWTFRTLGPNLTDTVVTRKEHTLVTNGPYRWVRHPFYLAGFLAVLTFSLAAANWFLLLSGSLAILLLTIRSRKEEQNLIARFGDDYRAYMQRTGRFLPRLPCSGASSERRKIY